MYSAIGSVAARQLRLASLRSVRLLTVSPVARSAVVVLQRGFSETRRRLQPAASKAAKPKATKSKAVKSKATRAKPATKKAKAKTKKPAAKKTKRARASSQEQLEKKKAKAEREKAKKAREKERVAKQQKKAETEDLKRIALVKEEPKRHGYPRGILGARLMEERNNKTMKEIAAEIKDITDVEKERLTAVIAERKATAKAQYEAFLKSKTPLEIFLANRARFRLSFRVKKPYKQISDPRLPSPAMTPFMLFSTQRWRSGNMKDQVAQVGVKGSAQKLAEEWRALSEADRRPYMEEYEREKERYVRESKKLGLPINAEAAH